MAIPKNIEDLNIADITEETLLDDCIEMGESLGVDTNQGSIYRDASDGHILRTAKFFNDLNMVSTIISIDTCTGVVLDERLRERGMERNPPADTEAVYYVEFVGADPQEGATVTCDGHFFTVEKLNGRWAIRSQETGTAMNVLVSGAPVIPEIDVDNLISATLKEIAIPAVDQEDDESARERFIAKIAGPSENGNKAQMQSWCEAIAGVGRARIVPTWNGAGTVLGIVVSSDGTKPSSAVVKLVQDTIDPGSEGMGEGLATIGCHFTAKAAEEVKVSVDVDVANKAESAYSNIQSDVEHAVTAYLKELALSSASEEIVVRYNSVGALIANIDSVVDYDNLKLNGSNENISCTRYQVPVIGEVTVNGSL